MKIQRYKRSSDCSFALGATLTYELIECAPDLTTRVYLSSLAERTPALNNLISRCISLGIPIEVNDKAFNILSPKGNCFVIAEFQKSKQMILPGSHIVLVNPSDAGNLGTILRTATGFGLNDVAIIGACVDCYDPKVIRASMGAAFHVRIECFASIQEYIERFPENKLYAFMLTASVPIHNVNIREPYSLVFGNEATGLPENYAEFCQSTIIPHSNNIDSLNLPIAASIAMYEFTKSIWRK